MHKTITMFALVSVAFLTDVLAQTVIDDTTARLPNADTKTVLRVVAAQLRDAGSAQIRGLKSVDATHYCGQVNAKTVRGGYAGFRPFVVSLAPPAFVVFQAPGNEGQFEAGATVLPMPEPGNGCGAEQ